MKYIAVPAIALVLLLQFASGASALTAEYEESKNKKFTVGDRLPENDNAAKQDKVESSPPQQKVTYRVTEWLSLIPKNWDPAHAFKKLDIDNLSDDDPRAVKAMEEFKKAWDKAPVEPKLKGAAIRIAGFVVALEHEEEAMKEFLLVPYFGACIHAPPPPANQIIHVTMDNPVTGYLSMEAVWVSGILGVQRADTPMGAAGYTLQGAKVERYIFKK